MTFVVRPLRPEADLPALVRLRTAIVLADRTGEAVSEAALRERLNWKNQAHWVAEMPEHPSELAGYASSLTHIKQRCDCLVEVHPAWRRRGLGSALLQRLLQRAREQGAQHVAFYEYSANVGAQAFLTRAGFDQVGEAWELHASADCPIAEPEWPAGFSLRTYAQNPDLSQLLEVCNRSRRDMWGHWENYAGAVTEEVVMRWLPHWAWNGIFLVLSPAGEAVGVCRAELNTGGSANIDPPTIVPEHRHQLLQRPLLLTAWRWLRAQGAGQTLLQTWGDAASTVALYRILGFQEDAHYLAYRYAVIASSLP
jgi:mycothiol synthase